MHNNSVLEDIPAGPDQAKLQTAISAEQIKALYQTPAIMLFNAVNAVILAAVLWQAYPAWVLLLWVGLFCGVLSARFVERARFLREPHAADHAAVWAKRFSTGAAATGLLWGLSASAIFVSPDPLTHVVVAFVIGGITVGAVFQQSAYLPAFLAFTLPAVVPQVVCFLVKGDRASVAMGLMLAVYAVVVALMGRYINRRIVETVRLRLDHIAANNELRAAVADSKAVLNEIEQIYRYSPVGLCFMDVNHRFVRINEHMAEINGLPVSAHIGRTLREIIPGLADEILELHRPVYERGEPVLNAEMHGATPAAPDVPRCWLANFFPFRSESGEVTGLIGMVLDITALKNAQLALRQSEERFRTIFDLVNDLIFVREFETGAVVEVNQRACEMLGYTRDELLTQKIGGLAQNEPPYTAANFLLEVRKARSGMPQTFDWRAKTKDGRLIWVEVSLRRAKFGGRELLLSTAREISRRKEAEDQLKKLAQFDLLTGLANRGVFVAEVGRAIERARRGERGSRCFISISIISRMSTTRWDIQSGTGCSNQSPSGCRRTSEWSTRVARFGGDEFALLMADIADPTDAGVLANKLLQIMSEPFMLDDNQIQAGVSIGIATYEPGAADAESLLAHADVALYLAKSEGRHTYRFFTDAMDAEVRQRVTLTSELYAGIAAGQLSLVYQPQVDMETSRLVGLEALVRWNHPTRGVLSPGEFLPAPSAAASSLCLETGFCAPLAGRLSNGWNAGIALPPVAINVSALQFKASRDLEKEIDTVLADTGLPPGLLEIEMTETALMGTSSAHDNVVDRLRKRGLRIAIDDFGTGYSSLLYLRRFPVDRIKIAQEFVKDIGVEANDTAIVKAAIGLARELGIGVLAEGVETADQLSLLYRWGCRQAQGFYFAAPMPAEDILPLLRTGSVLRWLAGPSTGPSYSGRLGVIKSGRSHRAPKSSTAH